MTSWTLACSACDHTAQGNEMASVCPKCGQPLLVLYEKLAARDTILPRWDMWRYSSIMPISPGEHPVSLGEGASPLIESPRLAKSMGLRKLWIKDEGLNPTASFKARGMSAAVTRALHLKVAGLVVPTAGNAGAALAAYGSAAGLPVRVFAPETTPPPILATIRALGAVLELVAGHIGDAGKKARAFSAEHGFFDMSTLREPYRIEGKKTMGIELAEQMGWRLPDAIIYPTGGGTGLIGMWKVFSELVRAGWIAKDEKFPRMVSAQADGCAPIVRAWEKGETSAVPWENPETHASGLRVPGPLGDRLILKALRESKGDAASVGEDAIREATLRMSRETGIDAAPEGGCALAVTEKLVREGRLDHNSEVVIYNTGSGASYRF